MEQLFSAIPMVLNGLGPQPEIDKAVVFAAWTRCAGELLKERTAPLGFSGNRLVIAVQDNTWCQHLETLSPQMLVRINSLLGQGQVKFIEFRIDESAVNAGKGIVGVATFRTKEITPSLAKAAAAIADEDLRKTFLGAAAVYLANLRRD